MKRQNGEGSITILKSGKVRVRVEVDPVDGKRQWLSATADTKKEALRKLRELMRKKEDKKYIRKSAKTYSDVVAEFLDYKKKNVKPTTYQTLANFFKTTEKTLGLLPVQNIKETHINNLIDIWKQEGNIGSTMRTKCVYLSTFFLWAKKQKLIMENPVEEVHRPANTISRKKFLEVLNEDEHKQIRNYLKKFFDVFVEKPVWFFINRMYPLYLLAYETGMRKSEILGLKWQSVDFTNKVVFVENNLVSVGGKLMDVTPKTKAGYRCIRLSDGLVEVLRILKDLYEKYNYKSEYVFGTKKGGGCNPVYFTNLFQESIKNAGITRSFTFHDIRHTNASLMIHKGIDDAVITERLGHSSIVITLNTYAHIYNNVKQRQSVLIDATI